MYPDTLKDHEWWELDDWNERLHGTRDFDDYSPYDPLVADAPEDIKRINGKNDHEHLHNAKLSPTGYYTGWFHKDYEGLYA